MRVIGVTGGVGVGKSSVMSYLHERYGAFVCIADDIARQLQRPGTTCFTKIVEQFGGEDILDKKGWLDRQKLSSILFADEEKLRVINQIIHPEVRREIERLIRQEEKKNTSLFLIEAALLIECHYEDLCDEFWFVHADEPTRIARLKESRGYSSVKIKEMIRAQLPDQIFYDTCQNVIENGDNFTHTKKQLDQLMSQLERTK